MIVPSKLRPQRSRVPSSARRLRGVVLLVTAPAFLLGLRCPSSPEEPQTPADQKQGAQLATARSGQPSTAPQAESGLGDSTRPRTDTTPLSDDRTWIEMRNVDLRLDEHAVLHVKRLHGEVIPKDGPVMLDDTKSFEIRILSATVWLSAEDLTTMLNRFVFAYPGAPIKNLKVRIAGNQIIQTGTMHKGVDFPFSMTASLSVMPDGRVRMRPTKTDILGVDGMKFLSAMGLKLEQLIELDKSHGAEVQGNDIYLDATKLTPPPKITGRLSSVRIQDGVMIQEFERLPDDTMFTNIIRPDSTIPNFIYFRGGHVRFGKLLMTDADMLIADEDPSTPFDVYLAKYKEQLVQGISRTLPNLGLIAIWPDYKSQGKGTRGATDTVRKR